MTTPITASYGTITLKAIGNFPARIVGGAGIDVTATGGFTYRVDMDIGELPTAPIGAAAGKFTSVWDSADNTLKKIEFTALPPPIVDWTLITSKPSTFPPTLPIAESGVTNLVTDLAARPIDAPLGTTTYGRRNGAWVDVAAGVTITVNWGDIVGKPSTFPPSAHTHTEAEVIGLTADLALKEDKANKGVANGYAALDATGRVPIAQGSIGDASSDGKAYGRLNGTWFPITGNFVSQTGVTGAGALPAGTTAQRPANSAGLIRYNSDLAAFEGNNGSAWAGIGGGAKISDTPPATPQPGDLWWESDTGQLFIRFDDGSSQQWVVATPGVDLASFDQRYRLVADGGMFKVSSGSLASPASVVDIALPAGYSAFEIIFGGFAPATTASALFARWSADGSTFLTANYTWGFNTITATNTPQGASANAQLGLIGGQSNAPGTRAAGRILIPQALPGVSVPSHTFQTSFYDGTNYAGTQGWGTITTALTGLPLAVRLFYSAGNIQAGATWQLNGYK